MHERTALSEQGLAPEGGSPAADADLVERLRQRDEQALLALYRRYGGLVYSVAYRILDSAQDAEEVTQDVFLRLWRPGHGYESTRGSLAAWLSITARHAAIDRFRRTRRREPGPASVSMDESPQLWESLPAESGEDEERRRSVAAMVRRLAEPQREAIVLAFFYGLPQSEIAEVLNRPLGTVKSQIRQGMERLRQIWLAQDA